MGFAGYYPDGTDKETANPIEVADKPVPVSDTTTPELVPKNPELVDPPDEKLSHTHFVINTFSNITSIITSNVETPKITYCF